MSFSWIILDRNGNKSPTIAYQENSRKKWPAIGAFREKKKGIPFSSSCKFKVVCKLWPFSLNVNSESNPCLDAVENRLERCKLNVHSLPEVEFLKLIPKYQSCLFHLLNRYIISHNAAKLLTAAWREYCLFVPMIVNCGFVEWTMLVFKNEIEVLKRLSFFLLPSSLFNLVLKYSLAKCFVLIYVVSHPVPIDKGKNHPMKSFSYVTASYISIANCLELGIRWHFNFIKNNHH